MFTLIRAIVPSRIGPCFRQISRHCGLILALALLFLNEPRAAEVMPGCASPRLLPNQRVFFVDPLNGNMGNDGSAARPWRTLAEVLDRNGRLANTKETPVDRRESSYDKYTPALIHAGDTIYLLSGNHGNVKISGVDNPEFIFVQAAPGEIPVLQSLTLSGTSKWVFVGLKVLGRIRTTATEPNNISLVQFVGESSAGRSENIIFEHGSVSSTEDTSLWSDLDWVNKSFSGIDSSAKCVAIIDTHFYNLRNALGISGDSTLISGNNIENFGNDAIDIAASNLVVRNNIITKGHHTSAEPLHPDGIQGWTLNNATNRNVVIDANIIIKTGDANMSSLQGISIFDGRWDDLIISNNIVITNSWHGISVYGVKNAKIINNTVVAHDPLRFPTWIAVNNGKDRTPSQNVIVRNNITTQLLYEGTNITVDHNIIARTLGANVLGRPVYHSRAGRYGDHNLVDPHIYETLVNVDHTQGKYDLHLRRGSPAVGSGSPDQAPRFDITGKARTPPIDIGAYAE